METRFESAILKTRGTTFIVLFLLAISSISATTHIIKFGGNVGFEYSPNSLNVSVGDTVIWQGDFSQHPLSSTSVPTGASSFHEGSGSSFSYRVTVAGTYQYRCDFHFSSGMTGSFTAITTGIDNTNNLDQDLSFSLEQNYPNPFNPSTVISFEIPKQSHVQLKIFDILGREVANLVDEEKPAGKFEIKFDGNNLASGIYFCQISSEGLVRTRKMVLLK